MNYFPINFLNFNKNEYHKIFKESILKPLIYAFAILLFYVSFYIIYFKYASQLFKFDYISNLVGLLLVCDFLYMVFSCLKSIIKITGEDKGNFSFVVSLLLNSIKLFIPVIIVYLTFNYFFSLNEIFSDLISKLCKVAVILIFTFFFLKLSTALEGMIKSRYSLKGFSNLKSRTIHTQITLIKKVLTFVIILFSASSAFMVFDSFRLIGATLFTSAGVISAILVVAGQKSVASLIAGFQIAFLQPIRVDDVVALENESGRIEEITLSFVTIALWDKRRLVVPVSYFIEKPFQNLSRGSTDVTGTVLLYINYGAPLDAFEKYAKSICEKSELWDKKIFSMQVTNTSAQGAEIRIMVSASDASQCWDLKCHLRRKMIEYIQQKTI